ncbi:unnamed protein product [Coffea canephora]|uniref:Uncharacterized protein n=1 Tax=Coffea canephora TaxID=49390 RepID=A0A068UXN0_COFCA|nr:unnamed protein product [Coffea canephora]
MQSRSSLSSSRLKVTVRKISGVFKAVGHQIGVWCSVCHGRCTAHAVKLHRLVRVQVLRLPSILVGCYHLLQLFHPL